MESPAKEFEAYNQLLREAQTCLDEKLWEEAKSKLERAAEIDPLQAKPLAMLAEVYDGLGDGKQSDTLRARAKAIREEKWKREVEAELRGRHDMLGETSRHETP